MGRALFRTVEEWLSEADKRVYAEPTKIATIEADDVEVIKTQFMSRYRIYFYLIKAMFKFILKSGGELDWQPIQPAISL